MSEPKQSIAVLTDTSCDLPPEYFKKMPLFRLPLCITSGTEGYRDGVEITAKQVYARQKTEELKTSLPRMEDLADVLDAIHAAGYQHVVVLPISAALSAGTASLLRLTAEERTDLDIAVMDTRTSSVGLGAIAVQVAQYAARGLPFHIVKKLAAQLINDTKVFFSIDTLEYLMRGGRIGKVTALAGTLLSIKPIISFDRSGMLASVAKVRGRKAVQPWLIGHVTELVEQAKAASNGRVRYNLMLCDGGAPQEGDALEAALKEALPGYEQLIRGQLDATLAVHVGQGLLGAGVQFLRSELPG